MSVVVTLTLFSSGCFDSAFQNADHDMLAFRRPAVFVPRAGPSREQQLRAERLREWGLAQVVHAAELGDGLLAPAIRRALEGPPPPPAPVPLDGSECAVDIFDQTLAATRTA